MPAYLIRHAKAQQGDVLVEDPALALTIRDGWAILTDRHGICVAIPTEHVAGIQRVDEAHDVKPAPEE